MPARGMPLTTSDPVYITELELSEPFEDIVPGISAVDGRPYRRAVVLLRLHGVPLALLTLDVVDGRVSADELAGPVWDQARAPIREHLSADGVDAPEALTRDGIVGAATPRCVATREAFLKSAPPLTVVIPTRDRSSLLRPCIESILACDYPAGLVSVLVVDNAPADDSTRREVEALAREYPVRYAREDSAGSASARNRGMDSVSTDLVVFTDDDAIPDRYWLATVAQTFAEHPDAAAVTGSLLARELETPAQILFEQYGGFSRGFDARVFDLREHRDDGVLYPYSAGIFGTGNNMSFRSAALRDVGNFDPALGNGTPALGGVDSEVLLRTILSDEQIVYNPAAIVWHSHRPEMEGLSKQIYSYGVGLTAYLLKTLLYRPDLLRDFARRVPKGVAFALSSSSEKNEGKQVDYPKALTRLELKGMLYGPLAYWRSRRAYGHHQIPAWTRKRLSRS